MKIVIVGDGVAGQTAADNIKKNTPEVDVVVITEENYGYYSRIFLPSYIAGGKPLDKLILRKQEWYSEKGITLHLGYRVVGGNTKEKTLILQKLPSLSDNGEKGETPSEMTVSYDKLLLATGSNPRKIPFGNPDVKGVFTLRNIANADEIKAYIEEKSVKDVLIIGGGLLGIELAAHLREIGLNITVCEIAPYLLPRQLDECSSGLLMKYLDSKQIKTICDISVEKILGDTHVTGVRLPGGKDMPFQMIFQQLGIIPELTLAKSLGVDTERGIIVDEFMRTSIPDVYAAGDCIQFKKQIWGIIPASMEQSKLAAAHLISEINGSIPEPYVPSVWSTRLKVAGINLSSIGAPPSEINDSDEIVEHLVEDQFLCRKAVLKDGKLKSAILIGPGKDLFFLKNMGKLVDTQEVRENL